MFSLHRPYLTGEGLCVLAEPSLAERGPGCYGCVHTYSRQVAGIE